MEDNKGEFKLLQRINRRLIQGIRDYRLIEDGDHILIAISGGKDSLALAELMAERVKILKPKFKLSAAHVVMTNVSYESDHSYIQHFIENLGIPFYLLQTSFDPSAEQRKSPCFLCSWNRRKQLFELAKTLGCNKIALGHHMDDILATLLMNMTFQGSFSTMPPMLKMSKFDMTIIRPMCLIEEKDLIALSALRAYKKQIKNCPYESETNRKVMGEVLKTLEKISPEARYSLWASMSNINESLLPRKIDE
ncbi:MULTISPECIES: ATP-binding protein [Bacteroides]|uniref:ATP-binding protein n=1 Tax=Bacteroides TaxID=816 RepID=UPI001D20BD91|nr:MULTISPECIES: ATP-binding protein [Bacteroides]HJD91120.1 tRNA 2-thiocytidine biosynthesis TtcA family protein [Bacteroides coprosuis]